MLEIHRLKEGNIALISLRRFSFSEHSVAELPCFGLKVSAMLVHQRSDTRTVYFHALYFVLNLDNHKTSGYYVMSF